jgi:hypothetical protein
MYRVGFNPAGYFCLKTQMDQNEVTSALGDLWESFWRMDVYWSKLVVGGLLVAVLVTVEFWKFMLPFGASAFWLSVICGLLGRKIRCSSPSLFLEGRGPSTVQVSSFAGHLFRSG